ncbi:hypothetical protein [Neobacillus drentensis]
MANERVKALFDNGVSTFSTFDTVLHVKGNLFAIIPNEGHNIKT